MKRVGLVRRVGRFRLTCVAAVIGVAMFLAAHLGGVEFFEVLADRLARLEQFEADEVVLALVLVVLGILGDLLRTRRRRRQQAEIVRHRRVATAAVVLSARDAVDTFLDDFRSLIARAGERRMSEDEFLEKLGRLLVSLSVRIDDLGAPGAAVTELSATDVPAGCR